MPQVTSAPGGGFTVTSEFGGAREGMSRAAELLRAFGQQRKEREEREKERAFNNAKLAMEAVGKGSIDPSSSSVRTAIEGVRKFDPQAAELLAASLEEATRAWQQRKTGESAGQRWMQGVEQREAPLREIVQNPGAWQAPLLTPDMASARIPQVPGAVASELSFPEREAARVWAQQQGYSFPNAPTPIDPYGATFPADTRAHLAAVAGLLPPEVAEGERIGRGLRPSVGQVMQDEQQQAAGLRSDQRIALDERQQRLAEKRLELDQQKEARIAAGGTDEGGSPKKVDASGVAGWIAEETKLRADERAARLAMVPLAERASEAGKVPELPALSKLHANRIVNSIVADLKANGLPVTDAVVQEAANRAVELYYQLLAAGRTREEALREIVGG